MLCLHLLCSCCISRFCCISFCFLFPLLCHINELCSLPDVYLWGGGHLLQVEIQCSFTQTDVKTEKPLIGSSSRNLPAPAWGSAMKAAFERSQKCVTRCTCGRYLAASTFLVVSGRRKDPLWLHKWLHSRLLALYSYVARRLGANKPNLVADAEPAAGDAGGGRAGAPSSAATRIRARHMQKLQTSLSDST